MTLAHLPPVGFKGAPCTVSAAGTTPVTDAAAIAKACNHENLFGVGAFADPTRGG
jgi:hypothetical protein